MIPHAPARRYTVNTKSRVYKFAYLKMPLVPQWNEGLFSAFVLRHSMGMPHRMVFSEICVW